MILIQSNYYLGLAISGILLLITLFLSCLYLIFAKTSPLIEGGKGVYRYEKFRPWAVVVAALVVVATVGAVTLEPSRSFVTIALLGTPTPTSTPLPSATPVPTPTPQPLQGIRIVDVLVFDGDRKTAPYVDIKLRNTGSEIG